MLVPTEGPVAGRKTPVSPSAHRASPPGQEGQEAEIPSFGLDRRTRWSLPRTSYRPINLERRARFSRFDVA